MNNPALILHPRQTPGASVAEISPGCWHLEIPSGPGGTYRWAQLDDYLSLARRDFAWRLPVSLSLRARVSAADLPGTWGFGFWNDPFSVSLGVKGTARYLPTLPNAAWYFYAGIPNYLAFRDTHPAQGFLAATFHSPDLTGPLLAAPLLLLPSTARMLRRAAGQVVGEDGTIVPVDSTGWHVYRLRCNEQQAVFEVDGCPVLSTAVVPRGPLGLVIWIDNQYAAFPPNGKISMGTSPNPQAWMEVQDLAVE